MKKFSEVRNLKEAMSNADNYVDMDLADGDAEAKTYKPRSDGEVDFKKMHVVQVWNNPQNGDSVHKANYIQPGQGRRRHDDIVTTNDGHSYVGDMVSESVVKDLQKIVKSKKDGEVKFKNKETLDVDKDTAAAILDAYGQLNGSNKKRFEQRLDKGQSEFMKLVDFAIG